jgi:hypothetical protein
MISMATLIRTLESIYDECKDNKSVHDRMIPLLDNLLQTCNDAARAYYMYRETYNVQLLKTASDEVKRLSECFELGNVVARIVITSSLNGGTNLIGLSDIDITVLVDINELDCIRGILKNIGYVDFGELHGYHSFRCNIQQIEFEVKVREPDTRGLAIIALHETLNKLDMNAKMAITYGKVLFAGTPYYHKFKMLVYNAYFYGIEGAFMLS